MIASFGDVEEPKPEETKAQEPGSEKAADHTEPQNGHKAEENGDSKFASIDNKD